MPYFALLYDLADDYASRREAWRAQHLAHLQQARNQGSLLLAGALAEPVDSALLVFRTDDRHVVDEFARQDPYVIHGVATRWTVRPWTQVIAAQAGDAGLVR